MSNRGVKAVTLDDDSDRYRQPHNLYIKLGFKYVDDSGPEMETTIENLMRKENFDYFYGNSRWRQWYSCREK